jgi:formylglycine-generating enzyme required for sulfatase activity
MKRVTIQNDTALSIRSAALALSALLVAFAADARAVTITWAVVGNPHNATDTVVMTTDGTSGYGSVDYNFRIATKDVTASQYVEFLNTKDASGLNTLGLYNTHMSDATYGGVNFNAGNTSGNKYSVISGRGDHPVNFVTYYDTLRFANWLNNGGQSNSGTEDGAYRLDGGTPTPSNANSIARQAGATVVLPSENEWYKAAYYNPGNSSYIAYPTNSNTPPTPTGPTATGDSANFGNAVGNLTDVGVYSGTTSHYGAFDMGGNVTQWNEALINGTNRGIRGGSWIDSSNILKSSNRYGYDPQDPDNIIGFRLASVPEPSTAVLALIACGMMWWCLSRASGSNERKRFT